MNLNDNIFYTTLELMPRVPLNVYALRGDSYSLLIDTGIKAMKEQILALCAEAGNVRNVLITHVHADHIGCNVAVKDETSAMFFAAGAIPWIENMEIHYNEFCIPSEFLPDSKEQREEILGLMDGAVNVDVKISDGVIFRPGNGIELEVISLPGHKLEEVGFLNRTTGDFFTGDILLALGAPFFHGFQTALGFKKSLAKMRGMLSAGKVKRILAAHHSPLDYDNAILAINNTQQFLDDFYSVVLEEAEGIDFLALWKNVCKRMNKQLEFRGFAMLKVQVEELEKCGLLLIDNNRIARK